MYLVAITTEHTSYTKEALEAHFNEPHLRFWENLLILLKLARPLHQVEGEN